MFLHWYTGEITILIPLRFTQSTADHSQTSKRSHHIYFAVLRKRTNTHAHTHKPCSLCARRRKPKTRTIRRLCIFLLLLFPSSSCRQDVTAYPELPHPHSADVDPRPLRRLHHPRLVHRLVLYHWTVWPGETAQCSLLVGSFALLFWGVWSQGSTSRRSWFSTKRQMFMCWHLFAVHLFIPVVFSSSTAGEKSAPACGRQGPTRSPSVETKQCYRQTVGLEVVHFFIFFIFF